VLITAVTVEGQQTRTEGTAMMKAGFASVSITPPLGTTMMGFGSRDKAHGCTGIHDDIFVQALYAEHGGQAALILAYDLCFVGRADADRLKGAIGRWLDLSPMRILLNTSHSHAGPAVGTWYDAHPDAAYLEQLQHARVQAAAWAWRAREVTVWVGETKSKLPMNRRRKEGGEILLAPNPGGYVYDSLPICLLKDTGGRPVCLVFSVSCHPSMMSGWEISAEYPGVARRLLNEHLQAEVSLFLQGTGGDAKPSVMGQGQTRWRPGSWEDMEGAGGMVAREVSAALEGGLRQVEPKLAAVSLEVAWPLERPESTDYHQAVAADEAQGEVRRTWARKILATLEAGQPLPDAARLTVQGIQLAQGLRLVGIEGEAVAGWGKLISDFYGEGVTFPLGYCNGEGLYLPMSEMLDEGGYEVVSFWEYGYPSRLAKGFEETMKAALERIREAGVE